MHQSLKFSSHAKGKHTERQGKNLPNLSFCRKVFKLDDKPVHN